MQKRSFVSKRDVHIKGKILHSVEDDPFTILSTSAETVCISNSGLSAACYDIASTQCAGVFRHAKSAQFMFVSCSSDGQLSLRSATSNQIFSTLQPSFPVACMTKLEDASHSILVIAGASRKIGFVQCAQEPFLHMEQVESVEQTIQQLAPVKSVARHGIFAASYSTGNIQLFAYDKSQKALTRAAKLSPSVAVPAAVQLHWYLHDCSETAELWSLHPSPSGTLKCFIVSLVTATAKEVQFSVDSKGNQMKSAAFPLHSGISCFSVCENGVTLTGGPTQKLNALTAETLVMTSPRPTLEAPLVALVQNETVKSFPGLQPIAFSHNWSSSGLLTGIPQEMSSQLHLLCESRSSLHYISFIIEGPSLTLAQQIYTAQGTDQLVVLRNLCEAAIANLTERLEALVMGKFPLKTPEELEEVQDILSKCFDGQNCVVSLLRREMEVAEEVNIENSVSHRVSKQLQRIFLKCQTVKLLIQGGYNSFWPQSVHEVSKRHQDNLGNFRQMFELKMPPPSDESAVVQLTRWSSTESCLDLLLNALQMSSTAFQQNATLQLLKLVESSTAPTALLILYLCPEASNEVCLEFLEDYGQPSQLLAWARTCYAADQIPGNADASISSSLFNFNKSLCFQMLLTAMEHFCNAGSFDAAYRLGSSLFSDFDSSMFKEKAALRLGFLALCKEDMFQLRLLLSVEKGSSSWRALLIRMLMDVAVKQGSMRCVEGIVQGSFDIQAATWELERLNEHKFLIQFLVQSCCYEKALYYCQCYKPKDSVDSQSIHVLSVHIQSMLPTKSTNSGMIEKGETLEEVVNEGANSFAPRRSLILDGSPLREEIRRSQKGKREPEVTGQHSYVAPSALFQSTPGRFNPS